MRFSLAVEFYVFQQDSAPAHGARKTAHLLTMGLHSAHALAAKQPRLKSGGPQSVVSNAGEGLQRADQ